jgi:hypothetical protein
MMSVMVLITKEIHIHNPQKIHKYIIILATANINN